MSFLPQKKEILSGLAVRDEIGRKGVAGFLNLAVTPASGCVLSWDADGDGKLDEIRMAGGFSPPVRLRLIRNGNSYAAACGDGTQWTDAGTAVVTAAARQDVGVFMLAADADTTRPGMAQFADFTVQPAP